MTEESLALRYRPRTFPDMCGQKVVRTVLHYMIHVPVAPGQPTTARTEPTVPPGLLFAGPRGTGKTSAARILGAALNCQAPRRRPCTACPSCEAVAAGASVAVIELDAASHGLVEDVRKLTDMVSFGGGQRRVVILDEAHAMSKAGFEALLKTLEEPPDGVVFVLVTTELSKIPATIASRCSPFEFSRITPADITDRLQRVLKAEEHPGIEDGVLTEVADRADGAMRDALVLLEQLIAADITTMAGYARLHGDTDYAPGLIAACAMGSHGRLFAQADKVLATTGDTGAVTGKLIRCLRDVLVLHANGSITAQGQSLSRRQQLAGMVTTAKAIAALRVLWELQARVRVTDARAALELALVMCSEAMREHEPLRSVKSPAPGTTVSANGNGHGTEEDVLSVVRASGLVRLSPGWGQLVDVAMGAA